MSNKNFGYDTVEIANNGTVSASFQIPAWAYFIGVFFPAMDDGNITLEISTDDTNFYPVLDPVDGDDLVVCKSGADAGYLDISDYVRFVNPNMYLRLKSATSQSSGAVTLYIYFAG